MPSSETSPAAVTGAAPSLGDLMPWGVAPLRPGRGWVMAPDRASLTARWDALLKAEGPDREALFHATRSRTPHRPVGQLPGQRTGTLPLDREEGACPDPVRILHGAFDQQWLIPDHRLIDAARPELWRVADDRQIFALEPGQLPRGAAAGPALVASALLPDGRSLAGRPGRIRPLFRRPGGREPNLAPGLVPYLKLRLGLDVAPEDVLAWALANARSTPQGCRVPLTADPAVWQEGVELGHRILDLHLRGARSGTKPRMPGGRRPYVRAAVPGRPGEYAYQGPYEPEGEIGSAAETGPEVEADPGGETDTAAGTEIAAETEPAARPELWRVADDRQIFALEPGQLPR
ncbi:DNA methyltransferase, partial [Streptomyces sp. A7024]